MTNDIPFTNPETGEERNLPENLGEKMGWVRADTYTPDEVKEPTKADLKRINGIALADAVSAIIPFFEKPYAELEEADQEQVDRLLEASFAVSRFDPNAYQITGTEEHSPAADSALISESGSLDTPPADPANEEGTTEPKEQEQPGKTGKAKAPGKTE